MNPYITNECSIDSLRIRIPLEPFADHKGFGDQVKLYAGELKDGGRYGSFDKETGEIIEKEEDNKSLNLYIKSDGISTFYSVVRKHVGKSVPLCLIVAINSKMLKERYFEGITNDNIKSVYEYIISQGKVYFPFELMLLSDCVDIDFKYDIESLSVDLIRNYLEEHRREENFEAFKKIDNKGIQFGERKSDNIRSFFKVYDKGIELCKKENKELNSFRSNGSNEFRSKFLSNEVRGIVRFEYNIYDKKQAKRYLKIDDCTLQSLLNLSRNAKMQALKDVIVSHQTKIKVSSKKPQCVRECTRNQLSIAIKVLLTKMNEEEVFNAMLSDIVSIKLKSKHRLSLKRIVGELKGIPPEPEDHLQRFFDQYLKIE